MVLLKINKWLSERASGRRLSHARLEWPLFVAAFGWSIGETAVNLKCKSLSRCRQIEQHQHTLPHTSGRSRRLLLLRCRCKGVCVWVWMCSKYASVCCFLFGIIICAALMTGSMAACSSFRLSCLFFHRPLLESIRRNDVRFDMFISQQVSEPIVRVIERDGSRGLNDRSVISCSASPFPFLRMFSHPVKCVFATR